MNTTRLIYAVVDNGAEAPDAGLVGNPYSPCGVAGAPLEAVRYRDVAAVVSTIGPERIAKSPSAESGSEAQARAQGDLLQYQKVNFFLLDRFGLHGMLPLNFGLTAQDTREVECVLERTYVQLRSHLDRLKGTVELLTF